MLYLTIKDDDDDGEDDVDDAIDNDIYDLWKLNLWKA